MNTPNSSNILGCLRRSTDMSQYLYLYRMADPARQAAMDDLDAGVGCEGTSEGSRPAARAHRQGRSWPEEDGHRRAVYGGQGPRRRLYPRRSPGYRSGGRVVARVSDPRGWRLGGGPPRHEDGFLARLASLNGQF